MNTLRAHRKAMRLKQHALASLSGVSQTRISSIERYNDLPSPRQANMLASFFGIKLEVLFPDGTQMKRSDPVDPDVYCPPEPPAPPVPRYPREFLVFCRKCGGRIYLRADDFHPVPGSGLSCYQCGADYEVAEVTHNAASQ